MRSQVVKKTQQITKWSYQHQLGQYKNLKKKSEILIYTDSTYVKDGITTWIKKWEKNGWKTASKKPVKNIELWKKLKNLSSKHSIKWIWVQGHAQNKYNNLVDEIAQGAIKR